MPKRRRAVSMLRSPANRSGRSKICFSSVNQLLVPAGLRSSSFLRPTELWTRAAGAWLSRMPASRAAATKADCASIAGRCPFRILRHVSTATRWRRPRRGQRTSSKACAAFLALLTDRTTPSSTSTISANRLSGMLALSSFGSTEPLGGSDVPANSGQITLLAGSRSSLRSRLSRAGWIEMLLMLRLPSRARSWRR